MTTQVKLDAAFAAVTPIVDAAIAESESQVPVFARRQAEQAVEQHRAQIDAKVREILDAGIDAAAAVP